MRSARAAGFGRNRYADGMDRLGPRTAAGLGTCGCLCSERANGPNRTGIPQPLVRLGQLRPLVIETGPAASTELGYRAAVSLVLAVRTRWGHAGVTQPRRPRAVLQWIDARIVSIERRRRIQRSWSARCCQPELPRRAGVTVGQRRQFPPRPPSAAYPGQRGCASGVERARGFDPPTICSVVSTYPYTTGITSVQVCHRTGL
jgi:hypothetical protein